MYQGATRQEWKQGWQLEDEITELLKRLGAFRRGSGIRSPRSMEESQRQTAGLTPWMEDEIVAMGRTDLWCELDSVAEAVDLTPMEKAVLGMEVIGQYSLRQMARELKVTVHRVRAARSSGMRKCRCKLRGELPGNAKTLFWEELRQKQASIYRAPLRSRTASRRGGARVAR